MTRHPSRRAWLKAALATTLPVSAFTLAHAQENLASPRRTAARPYRIYAITFRGQTEVEKGFEEYFASRKIPVQIIYRDLNRDPTRMPAFLDEIRATRPPSTSPTFRWCSPWWRRPRWPKSCPRKSRRPGAM
jgi:hypothetical protein